MIGPLKTHSGASAEHKPLHSRQRSFQNVAVPNDTRRLSHIICDLLTCMYFYPAAASAHAMMKMNSLFPHSFTGGTAASARLKQLGKFKVVVFHEVSEQQFSSLLCGFSRVPQLHCGCFTFQSNFRKFGRILKSGAASGRMEMQCIVI